MNLNNVVMVFDTKIDDTKIWCPIKTQDDYWILQNDINSKGKSESCDPSLSDNVLLSFTSEYAQQNIRQRNLLSNAHVQSAANSSFNSPH